MCIWGIQGIHRYSTSREDTCSKRLFDQTVHWAEEIFASLAQGSQGFLISRHHGRRGHGRRGIELQILKVTSTTAEASV